MRAPSADRERMLDGAGDVALRALDGGRYVVSERESGGNGRGKRAARAVHRRRNRRAAPQARRTSLMKQQVDRLWPGHVPPLDDDRRRTEPAIRFAASRALAIESTWMPDSAAASATLGVTTVATGSRRVFNIETASGARRVRVPRPLAVHDRIDDEIRDGGTVRRRRPRPGRCRRSRACRS